MWTIFVVVLCYSFLQWSALTSFTRKGLSIHQMAEQEGLLDHEIELGGVESINIGWPRGIRRVGLAILMLVLIYILFSNYSMAKQYQFKTNIYSAINNGLFISVILNTLPILGLTLWQWGSITIDSQELRVPRIRRTLTFDRGSDTQIKVVRGPGGMYFYCAATNETQSAKFYTNARGIARLQAWVLPESKGVGESRDTPVPIPSSAVS